MGQTATPTAVLPLVAAFSRHPAALDWGRQRVVEAWGPLALESPRFDFAETDYYDRTMGTGLKKVFFAPAGLADPADLADWKHASNDWEEAYAALGLHEEQRPLNLDPGYLTLGKLVLASTKDYVHRIYLCRGIYAEITLTFRHHCWQDHQWTFPNYRRRDYQAFFSECRDFLHAKLRKECAT